MRNVIVVALAGLLAAGCQHAPFSPVEPVSEASVEASESRGLLRIRLNWATLPERQLQALPLVATRALLTVRTEDGTEAAARPITRSDASDLAASFALAPGAGYTISATLYDASGSPVAVGTSPSFTIQRQRVANVDLEVEPIISSVAGTGLPGLVGDGGAADGAQLNMPLGLAIAANGDLVIVDEANHAIRRLDAAGKLSTVVGTGVAAPVKPVLGDRVAVAEALLNSPDDVAVAPNGDLFIADTTNNAIRILPAEDGQRYGQTLTTGHLHTVFATAVNQVPRSVAVDPAGNLYLTERHRILMLTPEGTRSTLAGMSATTGGFGADGPALESLLNFPQGLLVDARGNLFFSEQGNDRVRMICREPGTYFGIPMASGSVYTIAGQGNATSETVPLGDGGDGLLASFAGPRGLALDTKGNLYIADSANHRVRVLSPERRISTFAGNGARTQPEGTDLGDGGAAPKATFAGPRGLRILGGYLYVSDSSNHRLRRIPL